MRFSEGLFSIGTTDYPCECPPDDTQHSSFPTLTNHSYSNGKPQLETPPDAIQTRHRSKPTHVRPLRPHSHAAQNPPPRSPDDPSRKRHPNLARALNPYTQLASSRVTLPTTRAMEPAELGGA